VLVFVVPFIVTLQPHEALSVPFQRLHRLYLGYSWIEMILRPRFVVFDVVVCSSAQLRFMSLSVQSEITARDLHVGGAIYEVGVSLVLYFSHLVCQDARG
jgi:hypothetical protein